MVSCGYASWGALQEYQRGIRSLAARYPNGWSIIGPIEERMRENVWREILEAITDKPSRPDNFKEDRPWEWVIRHSAYGREDPAPKAKWWEKATEALWLSKPGAGAGMDNHPSTGALNLPPPPQNPSLAQQALRDAKVHIGNGEGGGRRGGGKNKGGKGDQTAPRRCIICQKEGHDHTSCPTLGGGAPAGQQPADPARPTKKERKRIAAAARAKAAAAAAPAKVPKREGKQKRKQAQR